MLNPENALIVESGPKKLLLVKVRKRYRRYNHVPIISMAAVDCGGLDAPKSGAVELSGTILGSKATYSCFFSYRLVGVEIRECLPSGQWSEEPPTCECKRNKNGNFHHAITISLTNSCQVQAAHQSREWYSQIHFDTLFLNSNVFM